MKQLMFSSKLSTSKQTDEYREMFSENKTVAVHLKVKVTGNITEVLLSI